MKKLPQSEKRELEVLRQLLIGSELVKLDQLSKRLENHETFSSEVGNVLPEALIKSAAHSSRLSQAMMPTVEEIVALSVRRDINKFADALFPVIGPAIRKSISEAIRQMVQSMNQIVDNSLSLQSIKWRLESKRTGVPFSQIVMLHSLIYEVEQVFLIHQTSGLLLKHVEREGGDNQSPDLVSSMLTAIGDFVSDSFESGGAKKLGSIEVGELSIWIERSPTVILALAIRGNAPESLRATMQETLEQVESLYSDALISFNGDVTVFDSMHDVLFGCLKAQYRSTRKKQSPVIWISMLVIVLLLLFWSGSSYYRTMIQDDYLAILEDEPGYAITRVENSDGVMIVNGLRDPLSRPPGELLLTSPLNAESVKHQFRPYQSLEQNFVFERVQAMLSPPANVKLSIEQSELTISGYSSESWAESINQPLILATGVAAVKNMLVHQIDLNSLQIPDTVVVDLDMDSGHLKLSGLATKAWREMVASEALKIPGIRSYDDSGLVEIVDPAVFEAPDSVVLKLGAGSLSVSGEASYQWLRSLEAKVEEYPQIVDLNLSNLQITEELNLQSDIQMLGDIKIFFDAATAFNFEANPNLDRAVELVKNIIANAEAMERSPKVFVQGYSDSVGSFEDNVLLSRERANYVSQYLFNNGISSAYVIVEGLRDQVEPENSEEERRHNRRVEFAIEIN